jgi:D-alanyl-D-alanine carboxypeptidase
VVASRGRRFVGVVAVLGAVLATGWAGAAPASAGLTAPPTQSPTSSASATSTTTDPTQSPTSTTGAPTSPSPTSSSSSTSTATSGVSTTAPAATTAPTTTPAPAPPPPERPVDSDGPLTPEQVRVQLAQAAALAAERRAVDAGLQAASEQLQQIGRQVSASLDDLAQARAAKAAADHVREVNEALLAQLTGDLTVQRDALGQWARDTYAVGGPMAAYEGWLVALESDSTAEVAHSLSVLEEVGVAGGNAVQRLQTSVATQADATRRAALASAQAQAAQARAAAAVDRLRTLQEQARVAAARLRVQQAHLRGEDALTTVQRANLKAAEAIVAAAGPLSADAPCRGLDTAGFANGLIPVAALCPVWGAPGQLLRADAAAALRLLSRQYAAEFGRPICVTDSYRTLAAQVKVYAEKPALAATPGTSNHGLGVAVDLCGGIESFGTAEHAWMLAHAPLTGWFHPSWAGAAGSKPEPWHWEFAG